MLSSVGVGKMLRLMGGTSSRHIRSCLSMFQCCAADKQFQRMERTLAISFGGDLKSTLVKRNRTILLEDQ
jgi:hypothetical protein